jgi:hypothetical protein
MKNLLGDEVEQWLAQAGGKAKSDERLHLYGKAEARPGPQDGACEPGAGPEYGLRADATRP